MKLSKRLFDEVPSFKFTGMTSAPPESIASVVKSAAPMIKQFIQNAYPGIADRFEFSYGKLPSLNMYGMAIEFCDYAEPNMLAMGFVGINDGDVIGITFKVRFGNIEAGAMTYEMGRLTSNIIAALAILILSSMTFPKGNE